MSASPSYAQAVSAYAAHLRAGGTEPWSVWLEAAEPQLSSGGAVPPGQPLPDATHLELVRRLNLAAGAPTGPSGRPAGGRTGGLAGLADRVFATPSPGRGLLDVPVPWRDAPSRFGTPGVEPDQVPTEELVRLAVGVLAHALPSLPPGPTAHPPAAWPMPWRRRFRLHGSPVTSAAVRENLLAQGLVESDWRPTHVVIARPVEVMMAEHWVARAHDGGILKWSTLWRRAEAAGRLPSQIDVAAVARGLAGRRGEPVHVVVARDPTDAVALVSQALASPSLAPGSLAPGSLALGSLAPRSLTLGSLARRSVGQRRRGGASLAPSTVPDVDCALADLLRRLNRLTALTHEPARVSELAEKVAALVEDRSTERNAGLMAPPVSTRVTPPVTPPRSLPWARSVAAAGSEELLGAGYPVHGDPSALAPTERQGSGTVDRDRTLELALTACLRTWHLGDHP